MKFFLKFIGVLLIVAAAIIIIPNAAVLLSTKDDIVDEETASTANAETIIVLGASVLSDGTPSGILQARLDCAAQLYFDGAAPTIIVSGDNQEDTYNEVVAMKNYLIEKGVPSSAIFCDHLGVDTYSSMYRARNVFGVNSAIVVTQAYHLPRALFAAQGLGISAVGVDAGGGPYANQDYYNMREIFARVKDFFQTIFNVPVTVAGGPVSLSESGDVTN